MVYILLGSLACGMLAGFATRSQGNKEDDRGEESLTFKALFSAVALLVLSHFATTKKSSTGTQQQVAFFSFIMALVNKIIPSGTLLKRPTSKRANGSGSGQVADLESPSRRAQQTNTTDRLDDVDHHARGILNVPDTAHGYEFPPPQNKDGIRIAQELRSSVMAMYGSYLSDDGRRVNYQELSKSEEFVQYKVIAYALPFIPLETLVDMATSEKVSFWLNIYNSLLIHAMTEEENRPKNMIARMRFFGSMQYNIAGLVFSLQDIEHGVLRANRKGPSINPFAQKSFVKNDARKRVALKEDEFDCRIHFALNCGATSCPPVRYFDSQSLEWVLAGAAYAFIKDPKNVRIVEREKKRQRKRGGVGATVAESGTTSPDSKGPAASGSLSSSSELVASGSSNAQVELSAIFGWFKTDFALDGSDRSLLLKIAGLLKEGANLTSEEDLLLHSQIVALADHDEIKIKYLEYDWSLNDSHS